MKEVRPQIILLVHAMFGVFCAVVINLLLKVTINRPISILTIPTSLILKLSLGGALETSGVFCFTAAFQSDSSGFVSMFSYTQIVIAFFVDILLFHETFTFVQLAIVLGILLVCITVAYIRLRKMQKEHPEEIPDDLSSRSPAL